jgi:hypothetical protein
MQKFSRMLALAVTLSLVAAPAALAQNGGGGGQQKQQKQQQTQQGAQQRAQAQQRMMQGAASVSGLLGHAYREALHAHQSVAMGKTDMATNHIENVRLTLEAIDTERAGLNQEVSQQIASIREAAGNIQVSDDRQQTGQQTQQLVSQFVALYNRMPGAMGGGGGGKGQLNQVSGKTSFELAIMAAEEASLVQTNAAVNNWTQAQLHARDTVNHIDAALKASEMGMGRLGNDLVTELRNIRQDANRLVRLSRDKSRQTNEVAGRVVTRLGTVAPRIAMTIENQQGGGAGGQNQPMNQQQNQQPRQQQRR